MKRLIVDPSNGYLYGFPRAVPTEFLDKDLNIVDRQGFNSWLNYLYPESYYTMRFWIEEDIEDDVSVS